MSRHFLLILGLLLSTAPATVAQPARFRETVEPPLADEAGTVLTAAAREPRTLTPTVRWSDAPAPVVLLQVRTPAVLPVGQNVDVRLVVENVGRLPARNVMVIYPPQGGPVESANPPPKGTAQTGEIIWQFDTLAAGARQEIVLTVKTPANAADFEARARVLFEHEQTAKTRFAQPELKVRKTGPERALGYDYLVFGMEVTNTGAIELNDVTLTDELPTGLEHRPDDVKDKPYQGTAAAPAIVFDPKDSQSRIWKIGRMAPGQTRRVEYHVEAVFPKAGTIEHKAVALAAGGVRAEASAKVTLSEPKLEVKAQAPPRLPANQPARVRITLANRSSRALTNIVVTDEVADPCQLEAISGGGQLFGKRVQWIVPALPPNEERVLEMTVRQAEGGLVRHRVAAVYRKLTLPPAEAATEFEATASLTWDFRGTPAMVEVNGEVTYAVTVQNTGTKPAGNVQPVVELPPEMQLVKAEPKENKVEGQRVTFDGVSLPPGGKATYLVRAKAVKSSLGARVQADLSADVFSSGRPVRRQEMTAIGGGDPAPRPPVVGPMPTPVPVPPPGGGNP